MAAKLTVGALVKTKEMKGMAEMITAQHTKNLIINKKWCKGCGICASLCPKVLTMDSSGKAAVANHSLCTGCRMCESHCPDFAITAGGGKHD